MLHQLPFHVPIWASLEKTTALYLLHKVPIDTTNHNAIWQSRYQQLTSCPTWIIPYQCHPSPIIIHIEIKRCKDIYSNTTRLTTSRTRLDMIFQVWSQWLSITVLVCQLWMSPTCRCCMPVMFSQESLVRLLHVTLVIRSFWWAKGEGVQAYHWFLQDHGRKSRPVWWWRSFL